MAKILIVDDEIQIRRTLREILEFEDYQVEEAADGMECVTRVQNDKFDAVILDIKMPKMDGMEALERVQMLRPEVPVIMLSGHATVDIAVDAVKKGAFDFIQKPPDINRILITVRNAMERNELVSTTKHLQKAARFTKSSGVHIVGESAPLLRVKREMDKFAPTDAKVLILGQNGTGKELIARYVHEKSKRSGAPFIEVNCAAIPSELIESELFGHVKGAFTGAISDKAGKFEAANGGTIFLDEIGDMSPAAQAKVLTVLQEQKLTRVGSNKEIKVDVRIVAATNKDLRDAIKNGLFREDLYHRLSVIVVQVPTLNERRDDIPLLVEHFNLKISDNMGQPPKQFTPDALKALENYNWTGNIRELANAVERLLILCDNTIVEEDVMRHVFPNNVAAYAYN